MTLEDFFTLSELKDGLTAPERVNELITIMQKEKDTVVKNLREATRQWLAVANTIAATESKICLDLFVALDGLGFIDKWLNDAQSLEKDPTNSFLEDSIVELLRAVAKLQIDGQKSLSSGIGRTVQNLVAHSSSVVRDAAKTLCDAWMVNHDNDISHSHGNEHYDNNAAARFKDEAMSLKSADATQRIIIVQETTPPDKVTDTVTVSQETFDPSCKITHDDPSLLVTSEVCGSKSEAELMEQSNLSYPSGQIIDSVVIHNNNDNDENNAERFNDETMSLESADATQQAIMVKETTTPDEVMDTVTVNQETIDPSCKITQDDRNLLVKSEVLGSKSEAELKSNLIASSVDVNNVLEPSMKTDLRVDKDEDTVDDGESPDNFPSTTLLSTRNQVGVSASHWEEAESPKSSSSSESDGEADDAKDDDVPSNKILRNGSLDMELDYGMIDPLEVARQVANEVELEVDSQEQSCSTSKNISSGGIGSPSTPDSTNRKEKEVSSEPKPSPKLLPNGTELVNDIETTVSQRGNCEPNITASQISELAQASEANTGRGFSGFDLNQEVCSEEVDNPINPVSSAISVVSASRAAAATGGSPSAPLQFEGTLAWKGSASTSAFRPIHNNSKPHSNFLDIDLNVAEDNDDKTDDLESSVEASPTRPERPQLDLNSIGYDGGGVDVVGFDWRRDGRVASFNRNGWQSPSRSSSSSSKQPSTRKFDLNLNDQMVFQNGASLDHPSVSKLSKQSSSAASGGTLKQQESVISIFGTKVEVQSKDSLLQPSRSIMPTTGFNFGGAGSGSGLGSPMHYGNPSLCGPNNGFAPGPAMFFTTPMYGSPSVPIPYMVDSRGAPVVPHIMGSSSTPPIAIAQPAPPFVLNMGHMAAAGTSSGSSGLDLNTGLMFDGGNREAMRGLQQLFPQTSSSHIVGEKRREPDGVWELFPVNKHHQPSWR